MRVLILIIAILFSFLSPSSIVLAKSNYARAINSTNLYRLGTNNELSNIICVVEKTYFVEIISETDDLFKVHYNGVSGYVKKNDVKEITSNPSTPFPYNIKIVVGSDCNLRSTPTVKSLSSNVICTLPKNESNITFIGRVFAEEAIDFGGTTWYYVNYLGEYGYVYNKYIKSITPIYENTESVQFANPIDTTIINPITHTPSLILIIIMTLPCIAILVILYIPRKHKQKTKIAKKHKIVDKY